MAKREEKSVNEILNVVVSFLGYLNRTEDFKAQGQKEACKSSIT
ncbi:hypothetical protein ACFY5J_25020 [Peribacillus butanolivorans]